MKIRFLLAAFPVCLLLSACSDSNSSSVVTPSPESSDSVVLSSSSERDCASCSSEVGAVSSSSNGDSPLSSESSSSLEASSSSEMPVVELELEHPIFVGGVGSYRVDTGLDDGNDESGYWSTYLDNLFGEEFSIIQYPAEAYESYMENPASEDPVMDYCKGLCGVAKLKQRPSGEGPFAGVHFYVAGMGNISADASRWGGICAIYSFEPIVDNAEFSIVMGLENSENAKLNNDLPRVKLPKALQESMKCFEWSEFKNESANIDGLEAATKLVDVRFEISGESGSEAKFYIKAVGTYK